jgi:antitoxin component YwqK of YwqJK toxin-antitoxin module
MPSEDDRHGGTMRGLQALINIPRRVCRMKKSHGFVQRVALAVLIANVGHAGLLAEGTDGKAPPLPVADGPQLVDVSTSSGLARIAGSGGESLAGQIESDSAFYELSKQLYPNGKLHIERYLAEDAEGNLVNHGPYKEYDPAGVLVRSGSYTMGKMEGPWFQVIPSSKVMLLTDKLDPGFRGPFRSEANFINGESHGEWLVTDASGKPILLWPFELGKRQGVSTWFDSTGSSVREISYSADIPHGPAAEMTHPQGEILRQEYVEGRVLKSRTDWYSPGKKRGEEKLLVAASQKIVAHDWWNNVVSSEPFAGEPIRHGAFTTYYANGQKMSEGEFVMGEPHGEFTWWSENGQTQATGAFDSGKRVGNWVWWHANGVKMVTGNYETGSQVGQWSHWNADGRLLARAEGANFKPQNLSLEMSLGLVAKDSEKAKAAAADASGQQLTTLASPFGKSLEDGDTGQQSNSTNRSDSQSSRRYRPLLNDQSSSTDVAAPNDKPVAVATKPGGLRKIEVPSSRRQLR